MLLGHSSPNWPFYSCGCEGGFCFFKVCLNFGVESGLSTVHFPLGRFTVAFPFFGFGGWVVVKPRSSQVSDLFPKQFPIAPYLYPICFGKCCPSLIYIAGPKGRNSTLHNKTFYSFVASIVSFEFNITSLWDRHLPVGWRLYSCCWVGLTSCPSLHTRGLMITMSGLPTLTKNVVNASPLDNMVL